MPDAGDPTPFYTPGYAKTIEPRKPRPGELLFEFHCPADHRFFRCELRDHGEFGVEAQFLLNGHLHIARTFPLREPAVRWAEEERKHRIRSGVTRRPGDGAEVRESALKDSAPEPPWRLHNIAAFENSRRYFHASREVEMTLEVTCAGTADPRPH
jgi:hypothetical protein